MAGDKYTAVWVSHSSIGDFLHCPRAYFLNNIYRDPKTGHKIRLMKPPLALGQAVHEVIESLSLLPHEERFSQSPLSRFEFIWQKISGKRGGFVNEETEGAYKKRGKAMVERVMKHPGSLKNLAVKIKMELPYYWLSEEDNIILCGKIDWLEYIAETDSVHIIEFKTSRIEETSDSLQLPIYHLLVSNCQKRKVVKASYWYLDRSDKPIEKKLPDIDEAYKNVLKIAKQIKLARQLERFKCPQKTGCSYCRPLENIIKGEGELVGVDELGHDVYILEKSSKGGGDDSIIL